MVIVLARGPLAHILAEHHAGCFNTVNIRVSNLDLWNQIASAKSLANVALAELSDIHALSPSGQIEENNVRLFACSIEDDFAAVRGDVEITDDKPRAERG